MPKGELGTAKPYLRGKVWWIKYYVPGEPKPRYESSKSANKTDAIRLLNQRRSEIDSRQVSSASATVRDLLNLYLADQRKQGRHSYKQADGYVRLHLDPAFGKTKASSMTTQKIDQFIEQKQTADYANPPLTAGLKPCGAHTRWVRMHCLRSYIQRPRSKNWKKTMFARASWNTNST